MSTVYSVPDRRLPFLAVLADCLACAFAFPLATILVAPELVAAEPTQAILPQLPVGLLLINALVILLDPPEPPVWNVQRAILAGTWRATLLFIGLLWALTLTGHAPAVPIGLFVVAWGVLVAASATLRTLRLLTAGRITL